MGRWTRRWSSAISVPRRAAALDRTPLFAAILLPFRLLEDGWRRDDLLAWVSSPLTTAVEPHEPRRAIAAGPAGRARRAQWERALDGGPGEARRALVGALRIVDEIGREERTPAEFWAAYGRALARVGLGPECPGWEAWETVLAELREALGAM
ncbi:MAG: hypothetical protein KY453_10865, partial [Gemmatimonadetes bacterium]|nr:hypothetical protein [Gemmatimonadota bacterium]